MSVVEITYFSDALCVWAYVSQARLDAVKERFGDAVRIEHRFCSVFGDTARKITSTWKDKGGYEGFNLHLRQVAERFPHINLLPPLRSANCRGPGRSSEDAMKQTLAMNEAWIDRFRGEPAAVAALAVFALSSATLAGAWYFQLVLKILPCPLCLEQRISYYVVVPLSLLMAIAALVRAPQKLLTVGFVAIVVAALCGAALAAYHAGVEWHFWAGPTDCSGPLSDLTAKGSLLDQLRSVNVVRCDTASWRFLGISLAGYNVPISLMLAAIAAFGVLARKQTN